MDKFKFTSWNIKHCDKLITAVASNDADKKRKAELRLDAIAEQISLMDSDVLQISEGPHREERARAFFERVAPEHDLVIRSEDTSDAYGMQGGAGMTGRQWIWFLIRKNRPMQGKLVHLDQWQAHTLATSNGEHNEGKWPVSYPKMVSDRLEFDVDRRHSHWRHPQVLQLTVDGHFLEIIGCHLKSKINRAGYTGDVNDDDFFRNNKELVAELVKARVKITTEASDIRHFIEHRFAANVSAPIIVAGDFNDGPGKERIERRFLYHDLISSMQGEVFFARRFLNHALFDFDEDQRWTAFFRDKLDPGRDPHLLLDHVLFSQTFTNNQNVEKFAFRAPAGGGKVEHDAHHQATGNRPRYADTSDHRPVSMTFEKRALA